MIMRDYQYVVREDEDGLPFVERRIGGVRYYTWTVWGAVRKAKRMNAEQERAGLAPRTLWEPGE